MSQGSKEDVKLFRMNREFEFTDSQESTFKGSKEDVKLFRMSREFVLRLTYMYLHDQA